MRKLLCQPQGLATIGIVAIIIALIIVAGGIYWWQKDFINTKIFGKKDYLPNVDPEECKAASFQIMCTEGFVSFSDDLGCGCEKESIFSIFKFTK